jgi:His-Xaa-Ser system protein HxsD
MHRIIIRSKNWIKLIVDPNIYSFADIYAAGYVFLDRAYIYLDRNNKGKIVIWLFPKKKKENLNKLGMEFYNELLNYAHYFNILKVNAEVIKTMLQRALFSAAPSLVQEAEEREIEELIKELEEEEEKEAKKKK